MSEFKELPLHKINDPAFDARADYSPESVEDLISSIRQVGIIEPLVVRKDGKEYALVAGRRRLVAASIIQLATVPCLIVESGEEEANLLTLHENLYRKDFSPLEEARFYHHLMTGFDWTIKQVSERVGKAVGTVSERLAILEYPQDIQEALEAGAINIAVAKNLAQITEETARQRYLGMAIKGGATAGTVELWKNDWQREAERRRGEYQPPKPAPDIQPQPQGTHECFLCGNDINPESLTVVSVHQGCLAMFEEAMNQKEVNDDQDSA